MLDAICASGRRAVGRLAGPLRGLPAHAASCVTEARPSKRILPEIAGGIADLAFGVTEPNAGTDTTRIQTMARRDGTGWVVNGRKVWTTNAHHSKKILLLARTRRTAMAGPRKLEGMTLFVADFDPQAMRSARSRSWAGPRWTPTRSSSTTSESPTRTWWARSATGFDHLLDSLNPERILWPVEAVGIGRVALERAVQYAKERIVFDRPIGKNQAIAHPLAHARAAPRGRLS